MAELTDKELARVVELVSRGWPGPAAVLQVFDERRSADVAKEVGRAAQGKNER